MNAKRHFSCRWKYLCARLEERSNSKGLLRTAHWVGERKNERSSRIHMCTTNLFCLVEQLSHTVELLSSLLLSSSSSSSFFTLLRRLSTSRDVNDWGGEREREKMKVNLRRGRERSLIDIGRCVRFCVDRSSSIINENEHSIRHSTVTNFELLKIVSFYLSIFLSFLILCKSFRYFTCSSIIWQENVIFVVAGGGDVLTANNT